MATSCTKSDEEQIKDNATKFINALNTMKFDDAKSLATKESADQIDAFASLAAMSGNTEGKETKVEITEVNINGEEAVVKYTEDGGDPATLNMVKEDGKWLVKFQKEGFGGGEATETEEAEATEEATEQPTEEEMAQAEANIPE
ncbi:MAG: hypothetical protein IKX51_09350, partial [Bacteroidales bacterium]|nr:hypothetical protein [Bacteroidales bacterium]